eukprot:RCo044889
MTKTLSRRNSQPTGEVRSPLEALFFPEYSPKRRAFIRSVVQRHYPYSLTRLLHDPSRPRRRRKYALTRRERKHLFAIPVALQKYRLYQPLNDLWQSYITVLLMSNEGDPAQEDTREATLRSASLVGASLVVVGGSCKSFVGAQGIVVKDRTRTLQIITPQNCLKVLPKAVVEYSVVFPDLTELCFGPVPARICSGKPAGPGSAQPQQRLPE